MFNCCTSAGSGEREPIKVVTAEAVEAVPPPLETTAEPEVPAASTPLKAEVAEDENPFSPTQAMYDYMDSASTAYNSMFSPTTTTPPETS